MVVTAAYPIVEKHGIDAIMEPFVKDLNTLTTEGITVSVNGVEETFRGALLALLADNLASHVLGSFKESFSFAIRICRSCLVTKAEYPSVYTSGECTPL